MGVYAPCVPYCRRTHCWHYLRVVRQKGNAAHRTDGNGLYRNARRNERRFAIRQSDVGKRKRSQRIGRKQLYGNGDHSARHGIATRKLVGRVEKRQFCVGYGQDSNGLCNDNARGRGRAHGYACLRKALFGTSDTHGERGGQRGQDRHLHGGLSATPEREQPETRRRYALHNFLRV